MVSLLLVNLGRAFDIPGNKVRKKILGFEEWLVNQQSREDLIGDLARDPGMQNVDYYYIHPRRKFDEHRKWVDITIRLNNPAFIPVFNVAWREYLVAKEAFNDS